MIWQKMTKNSNNADLKIKQSDKNMQRGRPSMAQCGSVIGRQIAWIACVATELLCVCGGEKISKFWGKK